MALLPDVVVAIGDVRMEEVFLRNNGKKVCVVHISVLKIVPKGNKYTLPRTREQRNASPSTCAIDNHVFSMGYCGTVMSAVQYLCT
jgi:hypothetical protein